jgi:WD40 repeat protein
VKQRAAKEAERRAAAAEVAERKLAAEQAKAEAARQKAEASAIAKEELANAREAAAAADSLRPPSPSSSPRSPAANMAQQRLERAQSRFPGLRRGSHHHAGPKGEHDEEPETRQVFLSGTRTAARRASHAEASSSSNSGALAIESTPDMVSVPNTKASAAQVQPWRDGASRSAEMGAEVNLSGDCLALNDDGDTLVCIGADGSGSTVSTYSAKRGEILQNFTGHTDLVTCVATQGDLIASSGRDKSIRLWSKKKSNKCVGLLDGCEHTVYGLAMSGSMLASGEGSSKEVGIVRLWDLNASSLVATFSEHMGTVWSVALGSDVVVSASFDMSAKVWTSTMGSSEASTSLATLAHPNWVFSVSVEANLAATGCGDRIVRLWSLSSYSCLRSFTHGAGLASTHGATAVSNLIFSVRLSGSFLASGSECGRLCVWSLAGDGECCATLSHGAAIKGLAISKKGSFVASAGGNLKKLVVWRPGGGK